MESSDVVGGAAGEGDEDGAGGEMGTLVLVEHPVVA